MQPAILFIDYSRQHTVSRVVSMISCYYNMKDEMTLVLILLLLHQLNKYAVAVQIIEPNDSDVSIVNNAVYKVLQACSKNDVNRVSVIQRSNPITPFIPYKWNLSNTVTIYDYKSENVFKHMNTHPFNFQVIILYEFRYEKKFNTTWLNKLKRYLPWDRFVKLIAVTFDNESCIAEETARKIAAQTRKHYIIHICKNKISQRVAVWTINSFRNLASTHWFQSTDGSTKVMGFSMRNMDEHIDTCDSVFYYHKNVTRRNGGYTITSGRAKAIVKLYPPLLSLRNNGTVKVSPTNKSDKFKPRYMVQKEWVQLFDGYDGKVMACIFPLLYPKMSVSMFPEVNEKNSTLINWKEMKRYVEVNRSIILNSCDWTFISQNTTFTYPRVQREIRVITQSRGVISMPVRVREIFNVPIITSAMIISGLFILAQRYLNGRSFGNAILDAYCLILGLGIPKLPNTMASRIFFGSLIFYFIILCTHFQGNVTQIMTVPLVAANIDSLEDLEASGYTVYAGRSTFEDFGWFRKRFKNFVEHAGDHCIELVLGDPSAACIDEAEYLQHEILKHNNLQLVKEPIRTFYTTYLMHYRWDIKDRFEMLFASLSESGILHKWQKDIENLSKIKTQIWELRENHYDARMTLENWKIFFILLYAGLLISTIVWIAEILYARKNLVQSLANVCIYFLLGIYFLLRQCLTVFYIFKQQKSSRE